MKVDALVRSALRKLGALPSGAEIEASEGVEALGSLRQMYLEMVGGGMFGRQCDVYVPANSSDFTASDRGRRYTVDSLQGIAITLPDAVQDTWYRWDYGREWLPPQVNVEPALSGTRPPLDGAVVTAASLSKDETRTFVYDSSLARWISLQDLEMTSDAPLSTRYGDGLACLLAIRLAPEYDQDPAGAVIVGAATARSMMANRWDSERRTVRGTFY